MMEGSLFGLPFVCFVAVPIDKRHATVSSLVPPLLTPVFIFISVIDAAIMCVKMRYCTGIQEYLPGRES